MASYTGYIPALDASDYDTKISDFITDVETDMSSAQSSIIILNAIATNNTAMLSGGYDFDFDDGKGIILGDDNDTTIKHVNLSGTYITHNGTDGSLFLYSGSTSIEIDSSKITTNADIYITGSSNPSLILKPSSPGGFMGYIIKDSDNFSRSQYGFNDTDGTVSLARLDSSGGAQETTLVLNDNKTASIYGTSVSDPGADPVGDSDLCNKSYTDGKTGGLNTVTLEIGAWNMNVSGSGSATKNVTYGFSLTRIRNISVIVVNDSSSSHYVLGATVAPTPVYASIIRADTVNVVLFTETGSVFDNSNFDDTGSFNRGWVTIQYTD